MGSGNFFSYNYTKTMPIKYTKKITNDNPGKKTQ